MGVSSWGRTKVEYLGLIGNFFCFVYSLVSFILFLFPFLYLFFIFFQNCNYSDGQYRSALLGRESAKTGTSFDRSKEFKPFPETILFDSQKKPQCRHNGLLVTFLQCPVLKQPLRNAQPSLGCFIF